MDEALSLWNKTLDVFKQQISEDDYNELFSEATDVLKEENGYIYVIVPLQFNKFRIETFYNDALNEILKTFTPEHKKFKFITKEEAEKEKEKRKENPLVTPSSSPQHSRVLSPIYTFKNFEVGESNRAAFLYAMKVAETPQKLYNPLYIFGDVGLGKTHLMTAIGHYILDNNIETNIVYVTSQQFAQDYFLATNSKNPSNNIENFYNKYHNADVLLVDDIQFLENKIQTQEEFFKLFDSLVNQNKQVVITSDKPANELKNMMERLKSRFSWGLSVNIKSPDRNLRINILKSKLSTLIKDPSDVPLEVLEEISDYFPNNIRDLEGALRTYVTYCVCMNLPFTKDNIVTALEGILPKQKGDSRDDRNANLIEIVKEEVAKYCHLSVKDLISSSRKQQLAYARHLAMFVLRSEYGIGLDEIGSSFGQRDHSSVSHGVDKIETMLQENNMAKLDVDNIKKAVDKALKK